MTTVTAVTAFLRAVAVCKTSSRSSRPSRGAGPKVKGAYLRVEIAVRQYNPNPLTFGPRRTLAGWGERLCLSPPAQRRVSKFRRGAGCPFQRAYVGKGGARERNEGWPKAVPNGVDFATTRWGSRPQTAGATPPLHPVGRKCAFDGRKAVKSAFALLSQKVTKAAAGAAKGVLI